MIWAASPGTSRAARWRAFSVLLARRKIHETSRPALDLHFERGSMIVAARNPNSRLTGEHGLHRQAHAHASGLLGWCIDKSSQRAGVSAKPVGAVVQQATTSRTQPAEDGARRVGKM
jgi:hypothetical protein